MSLINNSGAYDNLCCNHCSCRLDGEFKFNSIFSALASVYVHVKNYHYVSILMTTIKTYYC